MKKIMSIFFALSVVFGYINILPVFAEEECISANKTVIVKDGASVTVGEPSNLTDGAESTSESDSYYQWNYAPWFCIDLGGYYEISSIKWIGRYSSTAGELEASIYGAVRDDYSDKELITESVKGLSFEYTIPDAERPVYRYIIVQRPEKGCGIGGKEFYVYGKDVSEDYSAEKAYDADYDTYWMSGQDENFLQLDLGEECTINAVELSARHDTDNVDERADFEIWLSNDEEFNNYVVVPCISTQTSTQRVRLGKAYDFKGIYRKEINLPDKYRYVRYVKFSGTATLSEMSVITNEEENNTATAETVGYETEYQLIDSAGDITNVFVQNSDIKITGTVKNSTETDTEAYVFTASYNENGLLNDLCVDEILLHKGSFADFCCELNSGCALKSFVLKKDKFAPLCTAKEFEKHTEIENAFYVSEANGDDNNDGTILAPFRTIERAMETEANGEVHIRIKNGKYTVSSPITVTADDSGSENGYIVYEGFGTDETVLSAGKTVSGFKEDNGIYYTYIEDTDLISGLYVNGERRNIASSGILVAADEIYDTENKIYGPVISKSQLPDGFVYEAGMEIYYPSVNWRSYSMKLENITDNNDESFVLNVEESLPVSDREKYDLLEKFDARAFYLRNSKQFLDEAGEWYFDGKILYYKPYEYEDIENCEVTIAGIDSLINLDNARYVKFDGLTFAHTGWRDAIEKGEMRWQGHSQVLPVQYAFPPSALYATYSENIDITNCVFRNLGAIGIGFNYGMKNCNIKDNKFYDTADASMYLGNYRNIENPDYGKTEIDLIENINVCNNVISNTGAEYHTAAAVQVYGGKNIYIEHNDISNCPYTAISMGPLVWTNSLAESDETHECGMFAYNRICNNYIHETNKLNPDGGAIYTMGHNHGTIISGNYIKNQYMDYGAIYNDKGSACFEICNNVMENVPGCLYEWSEEIYFIKAYNNYSTTDETYGGLFCTKSEIEDVVIFDSECKPEAVDMIIANAGIESGYSSEFEKTKPVIGECVKITANAGENVLLEANVSANDSGRYKWRAVGANKSNVTFKDTLHGWLKKGRQFEKVYATFDEPGEYEIICEADNGQGYIYANKQFVTVN